MKTVIIGGAARCALGTGWAGTGEVSPQQSVAIQLCELPGSESFSQCHSVRDGTVFAIPPPSRTFDVVIVGGGLSGLTAAYRLRERNILLLEKDPWVGGNAVIADWKGIQYSVGATVTTGSRSNPRLLYDELGLKPIQLSPGFHGIPYFLDGNRILDLEEEFARRYPRATKSFAQFKKDMLAMNVEARRLPLDRVTFAEVLRSYDPAVREWHDVMVDWLCCDSSTTSGLAGVLMSKEWLGIGSALMSPQAKDAERVTFPGGLGYVSETLRGRIEQAGTGRCVTNAMVYHVANSRDAQAEVSFLQGGTPTTVKARAVIVAVPKIIAKYIVKGLPPEQINAIDQLHYTPYLVAALCSNKVLINDIPVARCLNSVIGVWDIPDWHEHRGKRDLNQPAVVRATVPRRSSQRRAVLSDAGVQKLAQEVVDFLESYYPGTGGKIAEVRIHRRGHNWFVPVPRAITEYQLRASQPVGQIFFAHADSVGTISDFDWAIVAADRALQQVNTSLKRPLGVCTAG